MSPRSRILFAAFLAVLVASPPVVRAEEGKGLFGGAIGRLLRGGEEESARQDAERPRIAAAETQRVPESRQEVTLSFAPVVRKVSESVVNVYAKQRQSQMRSPFEGDPFFERFFGVPQRQRGKTSLGSGVVVDANGTILTNNHVIANMDEVRIAVADGREFDCDIVLKDEKSDLAVLKVKDAGSTRFKPIEVADSEGVEVGDLVLAIGNPFGVGQTVTMGIVSAVSRSLAGINDYGYFIQTDASINPGNSGGALVDVKGRLIGVNTMIYSRSGGSVGIGYAIPSNMTRVVLDSAAKGDRVERPWLGASFQSVSSDIAESLGLDRPRGAMVTAVTEKSPAEKSGLKLGDVVLAVDGRPIDNPDGLGYRLDTIGVGKSAKITVLSRGKEREFGVTLIAPPETVPREEVEMPQQSVLWGAKAANLSPAVAQEIGIDMGGEGVVLVDVVPRSPAAANGMRRGDVVREINGVAVKRTADLVEIVERRFRAWQFVVQRGGHELVFERDGGFFRQYAR